MLAVCFCQINFVDSVSKLRTYIRYADLRELSFNAKCNNLIFHHVRVVKCLMIKLPENDSKLAKYVVPSLGSSIIKFFEKLRRARSSEKLHLTLKCPVKY